ncbi:MAG: hypothetical protein ABFD89_09650 [Bryobacteraceae bacterium]
MPKLTLTDIHTELSSFVAAHDVSVKALDAKLDGITSRLDKLNGSVARHQTWIDTQEGREIAKAETRKGLGTRTMLYLTGIMALTSVVSTAATVWVLR